MKARRCKATTRKRGSGSRSRFPSQSPSLSGCLCENKSIPPSIIPAEVHKVDNPYAAFFLTHGGSELGSFVSCCEVSSEKKTRAAFTERVTAQPAARLPTAAEDQRSDARRRPPEERRDSSSKLATVTSASGCVFKIKQGTGGKLFLHLDINRETCLCHSSSKCHSLTTQNVCFKTATTQHFKGNCVF